MSGRVLAVRAKGVPPPGERGLRKPALDEIRVTRAGVTGDFNRWRHEKGTDDPDQAVLLVTRETLDEIRRDGWPVEPGDLGENLTIEGVPYDAFAIGTRWRAGSVTVEIAKACDPCRNLYQLPYVGDARGPEFLRAMKGRRGWFARVVGEGTVRAGDTIDRR